MRSCSIGVSGVCSLTGCTPVQYRTYEHLWTLMKSRPIRVSGNRLSSHHSGGHPPRRRRFADAAQREVCKGDTRRTATRAAPCIVWHGTHHTCDGPPLRVAKKGGWAGILILTAATTLQLSLCHQCNFCLTGVACYCTLPDAGTQWHHTSGGIVAPAAVQNTVYRTQCT